MTFIFKTRQYFGTSQNEIDDKKSGTKGVSNYPKMSHIFIFN